MIGSMLTSGFAAIALKATIALLAALLLIRLARGASASLRHLLAAATFAVLLFLPVAGAFVPERPIHVSSEAATPSVAERPAAGGGGGPTETVRLTKKIDWMTVAYRTYFAGAAFIVLSLLAGIARVMRMRDRAEVSVMGTRLANEMRRGIQVSISSELAVPITFGSTILLPAATAEWSEEELQRAVRHEVEHVARGDWMTQIVSRLACALYWPHPFVWVLWSRLRLEAERACDDAVIRGAAEPETYAEQLVALARRLVGRGSVPALAMATRTNLGQRVEAILDRRLRRAPLSRLGTFTVSVIAVAVMLTIAPFRLMSAPVQKEYKSSRGPADERLFHAAAAGDVEMIRRLLDDGADPDMVIIGDGTPLIAAASGGQIEAMRVLLDAGADPDLGVGGDGNALIAAAESGHLEAVQLLLDRRADIDRGVVGDGNALIAAAGSGHVEVVRYLLDRGANIEQVVPGDENALIQACERGSLEAVRLLIDRGANVNARVWAEFGDGRQVRGEWRTPLNRAQRGGHGEIVNVLRAAGARE